MRQESRTAKSVKNAKIALLYYCLNLVLNFFSRKFFLEYLGAEILGLNTTVQNLLGFLNLAELGIGAAVSFLLYRPLFEKDKQVINEIVSVQGWLYGRIAYVVIAGACVLMCFFPWIFNKANLPLWYTYGTFIVLLTTSLLGYFINYRQIVLTADQKDYKITQNIQGFKIIKVILQLVAIYYLSNGYVYWLGLEFLFAFVTAIVLNYVLRHEYPWLKTDPSQGRLLKNKYPEIIIKTKQMFFHRIGGVILFQSSPIIIYAYASLTLVALYGNYMLIVSGVTMLSTALFNSVTAGVGNLVAQGDKQRIKSVFWELTSFRVWVASVICFGMFKLTHPFVALWVGQEFVLEQSAFTILIMITFISLTRTNEVFLTAYGLCQDIWSPLIEIVLNLGFSILLGYFWGLTGVLLGVLISLVVVVLGWKPCFLYWKGFKENIREYLISQLKYIFLIGMSFLFVFWLFRLLIVIPEIYNYLEWIEYAIFVVSIYAVISFILFYCFDKGIRDFMCRVKNIVFAKEFN